MLMLHHGDTSVASAKVRLALAEKGLAFESRLYDLRRNEHRTPDYLKINPAGVVPTLVHDGAAVRESNVILEYLEEAFPHPPLMPPDAAGRARVRLILREIDHLHDACSVLSSSLKLAALRTAPQAERERLLEKIPDSAKRARQRRLLELGFDAPDIVEAMLKYRRIVSLADAGLQGRDWLSGADPGLADCAALPYFHRADCLGLRDLWAAAPRVDGWLDRMKARASFEAAITRWTPAPSPYRHCVELQKIAAGDEPRV